MKHFETLEIRQLMSAAITDMTALAKTQTPHSGVTYLYLNFDGGNINDTQAGGSRDTSEFEPKGTQNRLQAIQDIVYKESEIFAPFNVKVQVMSGAGNYSKTNGNTTIFIGDYEYNTDSNGNNITYSDTPANSMDGPFPHKGTSHALNSDTYDIAFVDPVSFNGTANVTTESNLAIATSIAHEAGHTFGLAHVVTDNNGTYTNEMMSYDSSNHYFSNNTFSITDLNNSGSSTTHDSSVVPTLSTGQLKTQDSYTCLTALLGPTTFTSTATAEHRVADTTLVDPTFSANTATNAVTPTLQMGATTSGTINAGEYDVYNFTHNSPFVATPVTITVATKGGLNPQVFVYDSTGSAVVTSFNGSSATFTPNGSYKVVIGEYNDASSGTYSISLSAAQTPKIGGTVAAAAVTTPAAVFSTTPIADPVSQQILAN